MTLQIHLIKICLSNPINLIYPTNIIKHFVLGTNVEEARQILKESGLKITNAVDLDDAAQKSVACLVQSSARAHQ